MNTPFVEFRLPDGRTAQVSAGGIIGRMSNADLRMDSPAISEAHALVSRRGRSLKIMALRRWFRIDGERCSEEVLKEGQRIELAPDLFLEVVSVALPSSILMIEGVRFGPIELNASSYSLLTTPDGLDLVRGYRDDAAAWIFSEGDGWRMSDAQGTITPVKDGVSAMVADHTITVVSHSIETADSESTVSDAQFLPPTQVHVRYDTVHLHCEGRPPAVLSGIPARIVSELADMGGLARWDVVAGEVWRNAEKDHHLRQNWDRNLRSLRRVLKEAGLRTDLVRPDGKGNVELYLLPGDSLEMDL